MAKVKICGITNDEDAMQAAQLGADYIGFVVEAGYSKDSVTREEAATLIRRLPLEAEAVLVTVLSDGEKITEIAKGVNPSVIQLHGGVGIKEIGKIRKALPRIKLMKAISVKDESALKDAKKYEPYVDFILLDSGKGGTGKTHDWSISAKIVQALRKKVFLAGGLNPDNVIDAVAEVSPYAVDTNNGVKLKDRKKDLSKVEEFIKKAK